MRFAVLFTALVLFAGARVDAQIDPSSAMLLNPGRANVRDSGLDSGRYTVKPRGETVHATTRKTEVKVQVEESTQIARPTPAATPTPESPTAAPAQVPTPTAIATPQPASPQAVSPPQATFGPQDVDASNAEADDVSAPRPPRDERRFTMLELSLAPGYLYNDSKSTFAPRNYSVNAPAMTVDASVWTSPNFGVHTSFTGTLNANVSDSFNNTKNASASEQWFSAGARARSFFGDGPLAPTLQFGVDYREDEFRVPSDTVFRNKLTTSGLHLLIDAEFPTSGLGSWVLGGEFGPKLLHRESSNANEFRTGDDPQATTVGVHFGASYRFDHAQRLFWKISYGVEKDLFGGSTTINDPLTGLPQTNVSVTNSVTLFQLGYTWGN